MNARESDDLIFANFSFKNIWRIMAYVKPYRLLFVLSCVLLLAAIGIGLYAPYLVSQILVTGSEVVKNQGDWTVIVLSLATTYLLVQVLGFVVEVGGALLSEKIGQQVIYDIRVQLFSHLLKKPLSFFHRQPVGRLVTRVSFDLENISEMFTNGIIALFVDLIRLVALSAVLLVMDWRMGVMTLLSIPIMGWITFVFLKKSRGVYLKERQATAAINAFLAERVTGLKIIQIFAARLRQMKKMGELVRHHLTFSLKMLHFNSWYSPGLAYVGHVIKFLVIFLGGYLLLKKEISWQVFFYYLWTMDIFFRPIRDMAVKIDILQIAMASSERIFHLLDNDEYLDDSQEKVNATIKGDIIFDKVSFSYIPGSEVLKNISFHVRPKEKIALVGSTGSGKTTIIKLIRRLYDVNQGTILIDGVAIKEWQRASLRRKISSVQQDVTLFSGSLRKNISLDDPRVTDNDIEEAIRHSGIKNLVDQLPEGLDTDIRERGNLLSVGERQLISFSRAMVTSPDILILDEATSHIDSESEAIIQKAMTQITADKTCFIIAHRLSTIQFCDRIFVIEAGQLVESGSHEELIAQQGRYNKFYCSQFI